jgi:hypothetical protein
VGVVCEVRPVKAAACVVRVFACWHWFFLKKKQKLSYECFVCTALGICCQLLILSSVLGLVFIADES